MAFHAITTDPEARVSTFRSASFGGTIALVKRFIGPASWTLGPPTLNAGGQVAFLAVAGFYGFGDAEIWRGTSPSDMVELAGYGYAAPGGGTFDSRGFGDPALNASGQVTFVANVRGDPLEPGIFRFANPGEGVALARTGQVAPGPEGGTFRAFGEPVLNASGQAAFVADTSTGRGLFRSASPGGAVDLARAGQAAPGGDIFTAFGSPALNDAGQAAFIAGTDNGLGIFRSASPGGAVALARNDQAAPEGGTFTAFDHPALTPSGTVAFRADTTTGGGLFLADPIEQLAVARTGQALADSTLSSIDFAGGPDRGGTSGLNAFGQVAYHATLADGKEAIVLFTPELHYRASTSGDWDTSNNWTVGLPPGFPHSVFIDPLTDLTVTGPSGLATIAALTLGTASSGTAELRLSAGGDLIVTTTVQVQARGALTQHGGMLAAAGLHNAGVVLQAPGATLAVEALHNTQSALLQGSTAVTGAVTNTGTLAVLPGGQLHTAGGLANPGTIVLADSVLTGGLLLNSGLLRGRGLVTMPVLNDGLLHAEEGEGDTPGLALGPSGSSHYLAAAASAVWDSLTLPSLGALPHPPVLFLSPVVTTATGSITNAGTTLGFLAGLATGGAVRSAAGDTAFTDLLVTESGFLVGGSGDRFIVGHTLRTRSTQSAQWDTRGAALIFQGGSSHGLDVVGADLGPTVAGYIANFAWGRLELGRDQALVLQDGNNMPGGALYAAVVVLEGGVSQVGAITGNGLNIYYDPRQPANAYLGGQTYALAGGGSLAPIDPQTP